MNRILYESDTVQLSIHTGPSHRSQMFQIADAETFISLSEADAKRIAETIYKNLELAIPQPGEEILVNVYHKNGESYISDCPLSVLKTISKIIQFSVHTITPKFEEEL